MNFGTSITSEMRSLIEAMCDGMADDDQVRDLESLLLANEDMCNFYVDLLNLDAELRWLAGSQQEGDAAIHTFIDAQQASLSNPTTGFPLPTIHNALAYLSSGWPLAYMISAVLIGAGLLFGSFFYVSHARQVVGDPAIRHSPAAPRSSVVARVTGMVDCEFSDLSTVTFTGAHIPLDRKYAISSGLMEITYDTGAKVILQGPCIYEVKSKNGGFLSIGNLTGKVEADAAKGFGIRTPTATVTDHGTEFGVEVNAEGGTRLHVFQGQVRIETIDGPSLAAHGTRLLTAGQSSEVEKGRGISLVDSKEAFAKSAAKFVRTLPPKFSAGDAYAGLVLSMRPVVYYRMDQWPAAPRPDSYVLVDSAPGKHDGLLVVDQTFGKPTFKGRFGGALDLHGDYSGDYAFVDDYPKTNDDRLSVSAWVRPVELKPWSVILGNTCLRYSSDARFLGRHGQFGLTVNEMRELCAALRQRDNSALELSERGRRLTCNVWHHVALVADGSTLRLYHNGDEVAAAPYKGIIREPAYKRLSIGCRQIENDGQVPRMNDSAHWNGWLDEIAVFNHPLTASQVRQLYDAGAKPSENKPLENKQKEQ